MWSTPKSPIPWLLLASALIGGACGGTSASHGAAPPLAVYVVADDAPARQVLPDALAYLPEVNPPDAPGAAFALTIHLESRTDCSECFSVERTGSTAGGLEVRVRGGAPLGLQYGLYQVLEDAGYRFFSPYLTHTPARVDPDGLAARIAAHGPEDATPLLARRGLHLHTLHPVEALFDVWLGAETDRALRVLDWIVKSRGNYVQWVALDDIQEATRHAQWETKTRALLEAAHARGVQVGINALVFAGSSLQNAYVVDTPAALETLLDLPFDVLNLSFGEFLGEDPEVFVETVQSIEGQVHGLRPDVEITATVHVGNYDRLWVDYQGQHLLYYFLVQFVAGVTPWVHTVMYFDLVEPTVGAYMHDDFADHRRFLYDRLRRGAPVAYFPESAYWIAFDDSVPVSLPLYLRSRWLDIVRMAQAAGVDPFRPPQATIQAGHVIFSSGWEWGYWQTDALTLRQSFAPTTTWSAPLADLLSPLGAAAGPAAMALRRLGEAQHHYLIEQALAPYFAATDFYVEMGHLGGIIGQPDRVLVDEAANLDPEARQRFRQEVIAPLAELAAALSEIRDDARGALAGSREPVLGEIWDGLQVDALRAAFVHAVYRAAVDADPAALDEARALLDEAKEVVAHRHAHLAYPDPAQLTAPGDNPTIYPFGYLRQADTLCLWRREWVKAENVLGTGSQDVPWCID